MILPTGPPGSKPWSRVDRLAGRWSHLIRIETPSRRGARLAWAAQDFRPRFAAGAARSIIP